MSINLTLLLQIVHFLIAYWFLRRFLFIPIVDQLQLEDAERSHLRKRLQEQAQQVVHAEEIKHAAWRECHTTLKSKKPSLAEPTQFTPVMPSLEHIELSKEKRHELIDQLSEQIAQKISRM